MMAIRWTRWLVVLVFLLAFLCAGFRVAAPIAASPHLSQPGAATMRQEDPGLPPLRDRDADDNGVTPARVPPDQVTDNDNDGLPNVMDPENNNGLPDADDGGSAPVTEGPDAPATARPGTSNGGSERPLVLALPSTGTGTKAASSSIPALLTGAATTLLGAGGISLRSRRS